MPPRPMATLTHSLYYKWMFVANRPFHSITSNTVSCITAHRYRFAINCARPLIININCCQPANFRKKSTPKTKLSILCSLFIIWSWRPALSQPALTGRIWLMIKRDQSLATPYLQFNRTQWAALRDSVPLTLSEEEIVKLKGINEDLSLEEVAQIYLPLSRLLNFYISSNLRRQAVLEQFLGTDGQKIPYVIGIAGSVAVGKSTTARLLQALLSRWPEHRSVELITTDGFLLPNKVLNERGLMKKKGFPQSYDMHSLVKFVSDVKSGAKRVTAPVYSHLIYDVVPEGNMVIEQPDILILEGLNVLQSGMDYPHDPHRVFVSDFVDFSIYVDAPEILLQSWYINRFLKFRQGAFSNPDSYFHNYANLQELEAINVATELWNEINGLNLQQNILPTRERASLIMTKSANHAVDSVLLRK